MLPRSALLAAAATLALTACSAPVSTSRASTAPHAPSVSAPTKGSPTASPSAAGTKGGLQDACGSQLTFTDKDLAKSADGGALKGAMRGEGATAVVLLHQTNNNASCGWMSRMGWLEGQKVRVVLIDVCGFGRSTCSSMPWADQVRAAVTWAKEAGSTRIVLLGSSLGGTMALKTGPAVGADALIDVSGPTKYREGDLAVDAPRATIPTLLVYSPTDASDLEKAKAALPAIPAAQKKLVETKTGHGYDTLDAPEVKQAIEAWIAGTYA